MKTRFIKEDHTLVTPSAELVGAPEAQVMQLDSVLSQLNAMRRTLAGGAPRPTVLDRPSRHTSSARGWSAAGVAIVVALALFTIGAWATAAPVNQSSARTVTVVHSTY